jgi:hypothetical protein
MSYFPEAIRLYMRTGVIMNYSTWMFPIHSIHFNEEVVIMYDDITWRSQS